MIKVVKKLILRLIRPNRYSSEAFVVYLRKKGMIIGENTYFFDPVNTVIDIGRASYIKIGNNCCITTGCQILAHDYSWSVLRKSHNDILPDPGKEVVIGDNVFLGWNSIVLGGVHIGSNVIVGAHSVVTKNLDSNSVYAGNPAKKISTLQEYYEKKEIRRVDDAFVRAKHIYKVTGRMPDKLDMAWFNVLWFERNKENENFLRRLPFKGDDIDKVIETFYQSKPIFKSYGEFLKQCFS